MSRALLQPMILAILLVAGAIPAHAQRPDPHSGVVGDGQPVATAELAPSEAGCGLVVSYTRELFAAIDDSGAFADYFTSDPDFGDVSASEAEAVIRDGDALIETLKGLDVPPIYADAHRGILTFLQFQIATARFFGIDSSVVPDVAAQERAFDRIEAGEAAVAKACPQEVKQVGGYILLDPSSSPENPGDPANPAK